MKNPYIGSSVESLFEELGTLEAVRAAAAKKIVAEKLRRLMGERNLTKQRMATKMATSRPALDRLLDPDNTSVSLATLAKAAAALDVDLVVDFKPRAIVPAKAVTSAGAGHARGRSPLARAVAKPARPGPRGGRRKTAARSRA